MRKKAFMLMLMFALSVTTILGLVQKADANDAKKNKAPFQVSVPPALQKVQVDQLLTSEEGDQVLRIGVARNEYESGQIVIQAGDKSLQKLQVKVSDLKQKEGNAKIDKDQIQLFKQHYIEVTEPTEGGDGPGWYPDALIPMDNPGDFLQVAANNNQGITVQVYAPKDQPSGTYTGEVWVHEKGKPVQIPIELTVWDFELSDTSHTQTAFAVWADQVAKAHGVEEEGDEYWELLDNYYWFQTEYRIPPYKLPIPTDDVEQYIEMAAPYLDNPKVNSFNIPFYEGEPEKTKKMVDLLREKGWLEKGFFYLGGLIDEPTPDQYDLVRELSQELDEIAPGVKHIVTNQPVDSLIGYVNTWAPGYSSTFEPELWQSLQEQGTHIWWYGSVRSNHPLPNYFVDDDLVGPRILSWMQKAYNVEGNLYWGTTIFQKWTGTEYVPRDVWSDPLAFAGANGDGYLMYPGNELGINGPVGTIRLEAVRDGMEDYEYLWTAEKRLTEIADSLGVDHYPTEEVLQLYYDRLFQSLDSYHEDPELLMQVRDDLATRIVSLAEGPQALTLVKETGDFEKDLHIYVEKETMIEVDGEAPKLVNQTNEHDEYVYHLPSSLGEHKVDITVTNNGETNQWMETVVNIQPDQSEDDSSRHKIELNYSETTQDLERWITNGVDLSLSSEYVTQGEKSMKAVYQSGVDWPSIKLLDEGTGFRTKDWSNLHALKFDVYSSESEKLPQFYVKFFLENGESYDNHYYRVIPNENSTIRIPLQDIPLDHTQMRGFELFMSGLEEPVTLYFDNFHFVSDEPDEPMTP